jgi:5S rRNA maturation endonuclease (ribonuclease M5)
LKEGKEYRRPGANLAMDKTAIDNHFAQNYLPFYQEYLTGFQKPRGNQILAKCRFHKDDNPSLDININDGRFYCHGCRAKGDIYIFYGMMNCLDAHNGGFHAITEGIAKDFGISATKQVKRIDKRYAYQDAAGALLYEVIRYQPKGFSQRRPNGKGGYVGNLTGVKRVLYHLPEMTCAQQVIICEGEKDVDNLRGLGFIATCNSEGAGKWKDEFADYLIGKDIFIIPDNDAPGQSHADRIALSLQGKARSIRVVNMQGVKDVSDYIALFGTDKDGAAESLSSMLEGAQDYEPKEPDSINQESPLKEISLVDDDEELEFEEPRPLIPDSEYIARCIKVSKPIPVREWGTRKIILTFKILTGDYQGIELDRFFDIGLGKISQGRLFYKYWVLVHGSKPTRNAKISPRIFINKRYCVKTKTVIQKARSKELNSRYSKVDDFELLNYPDMKDNGDAY